MVERFIINYDSRGEQQHPHGDFVHWPDYLALEKDAAALREQLEKAGERERSAQAGADFWNAKAQELAAKLEKAERENARLTADLAEADKHASAIEALLEPHVSWDGQPPAAYASILARATSAESSLSAANERIAKLEEGLRDIAESDDVDNALDPERNKRVARALLSSKPGGEQ